jgi:hypothetical protein
MTGLMHNLTHGQNPALPADGKAGRRPLLSAAWPRISWRPRNFCIEPGASPWKSCSGA